LRRTESACFIALCVGEIGLLLLLLLLLLLTH
jgi:hypothetical protein